MSYNKYRDLFIKAQKNTNAPYKSYSFDIKNSKKYNDEERHYVQELTFKTINVLTKKLLNLQALENRKILLTNNEIKLVENLPKGRNQFEVLYYSNPCFTAGDCFHYYTYNNSISEEEFLTLFKQALCECNNFFTYHYASGNFETTKYTEANKKYYVGYLIGELGENKTNRKSEICINNQQIM